MLPAGRRLLSVVDKRWHGRDFGKPSSIRPCDPRISWSQARNKDACGVFTPPVAPAQLLRLHFSRSRNLTWDPRPPGMQPPACF